MPFESLIEAPTADPSARLARLNGELRQASAQTILRAAIVRDARTPERHVDLVDLLAVAHVERAPHRDLAREAGEPLAALGLHAVSIDGHQPAQIRDAVQAWLMRDARRHFTARLDHFAPLLGVRWASLRLSSANTRWGSAKADGSIRLNWRLLHYRPAIIDYVVAHELAHLRVMDHSPRFWDTVATVVPDYVQLQVMHQLAVTGKQAADVAVLLGGQHLTDHDTTEGRRNRGDGIDLKAGDEIITSDGSDRLTVRDPQTLVGRRTVVVSLAGAAVTNLNELECVSGAVYANVWRTDRIVRIEDGRIVHTETRRDRQDTAP